MNEREQQYSTVWTVKELAEAANVTPGYIRHLLGREAIQGYKLGRDWLIPDGEARRFLASRE